MAATAATQPNDDGNGRVKEVSTRLKAFYADIRGEMKKVTWPSWKEVRGTTIVVLVTVAFFGLYFYVVDLGLSAMVDRIIAHFSRS